MSAKTTAPRKTRTAAAREATARRVSRWVAIAGSAPVVAVAAFASYTHIAELAHRHGQSATISAMMPLGIDGLMIVAAVAMIADRAAKLPKVAFILGVVLTLGANILSVQQPDPISYVIAGAPAAVLVATSELLLRLCLPAAPKRRRRASTRKPATKPATARTARVTRPTAVPAAA